MTKTLVLVLLYISCGATGDLMVSYGMKQRQPEIIWVAGGTAVLALGYAIFLGLLKDVPLSVVVPAGAGSYLLIAALSHLILKEQVPPVRWIGTVLVSLGVAMVMVSDWQARRSTASEPERVAVAGRAHRQVSEPVGVPEPAVAVVSGGGHS